MSTPASPRLALPAATSIALVLAAWAFVPLPNLPSFDAVKLAVLVPFVAVAAFVAGRRRAPSEREFLLRDPLLLVPAVLALAAAVAALLAWPRGSLQGPVLTLTCVAAARLVRPGADGVRSTLRAVSVAGAGAGVYAVLQACGFDPAPWGALREPVATFGNTSFAAEFQAAVLPAALVLALRPASSRDRVLGIGAALLAATHLVLATSRIDFVAAGAGLAVLTFVVLENRTAARRLGVTAAALALVVAGLFAAAAGGSFEGFGRSDTLQVRAHIWSGTLRLVADAPFRFGSAPFIDLFPPFRSPDEYRISMGRVVDTPHADLLEIAATLGIVGLAAAIAWGAVLARRLVTLSRGARWEAGALAAIVASVAVSGLASSPLSHPATALLAALAVGHVVALAPRAVGAASPSARTTDLGFAACLVLAFWPGPALRTFRADGFFALAMSHRTAGATPDAVRLFDAACAVDAQAFDPRYELGTLLLSIGRREEAVAALRSAHRIRPNDPECRTNLVHALRSSGARDEAERLLDESLALVPWHPLLLTARAARSTARGDFPAALADLEAAHRLRPDDLRVRAVRAEASLGAAPGEPAREEALDALGALRRAGNFDLMMQAARAFAARDSLFLPVLTARARRLAATDPDEAAGLVLAPVQGLSPPDPGYFADAARVLQQTGRAEQATRFLGRSLGLRGRASLDAGDVDVALRLARQAAERDPLPDHNVLEARCLARLGDRSGVRTALAAAASLGPFDAAVLREDPAFARLLPDPDIESLLSRGRP